MAGQTTALVRFKAVFEQEADHVHRAGVHSYVEGVGEDEGEEGVERVEGGGGARGAGVVAARLDPANTR